MERNADGNADWQEEVRTASKALRENPNDAAFLARRYHAYMALHQTKPAEDDALAYIRLRPSSPQGYIFLGQCHKLNSNFLRAEQAYLLGLSQKNVATTEQNKALLEEQLTLLRKEMEQTNQEKAKAKQAQQEQQQLTPTKLLEKTIQSNNRREERWHNSNRRKLFEGSPWIRPQKLSQIAGWGVIATADISAGTILLEEDPFAAGLSLLSFSSSSFFNSLVEEEEQEEEKDGRKRVKGRKKGLCDHCFRVICIEERGNEEGEGERKEGRCEDCGVIYCSKECWQRAKEEYHLMLCNRRLLQKEKPAESEEDPMEKLEEYCRSFQNFYALLLARFYARLFITMTHLLHEEKEEKKLTIDLFERACEQHSLDTFLSFDTVPGEPNQRGSILFITQCIRQQLLPRFQSLLNHQIEREERKEDREVANRIFSLEQFMKFWWIVRMNCISIPCWWNGEKVKGVEITGLFVKTAMFNHSCEPNAQYLFCKSFGRKEEKEGKYQHRLKMKAVKDIKKGEEVHISYVGSADLKTLERNTRREYLSSSYFFDCECSRCQRGE
ncbi:SET and MYND domain-containing protein 5 [Balamuthia mandrillaris]